MRIRLWIWNARLRAYHCTGIGPRSTSKSSFGWEKEKLAGYPTITITASSAAIALAAWNYYGQQFRHEQSLATSPPAGSVESFYTASSADASQQPALRTLCATVHQSDSRNRHVVGNQPTKSNISFCCYKPPKENELKAHNLVPRRSQSVTCSDRIPPYSISFSQGFAGLFDNLRPAVVQLYGSSTPYAKDAKFLGSGLIFRPNGSIVTAAHLFEGKKNEPALRFSSFFARLYNKEWYECRLRGKTEEADVALLRIECAGATEKTFPFLPLNETRELPRQGEFVVTYGTGECGDEEIAVIGTVAQPSQSFKNLEDIQRMRYIQLGMITMPGMSGAPVCDVRGRVVGMVVKKYQEYGLALPSFHLVNILKYLEEFGNWKPPFLGITLRHSNNCRIVANHRVDASTNGNVLLSHSGVAVSAVKESSPAGKAGMQPNDIIQEVNGRPVYTNYDVIEEMGYSHRETIILKLIRDGQVIIIKVMPIQHNTM